MNEQAEGMDRTMTDAVVKRLYYNSRDELRMYLVNFVATYTFAYRLKMLRGLTSYKHTAKI